MSTALDTVQAHTQGPSESPSGTPIYDDLVLEIFGDRGHFLKDLPSPAPLVPAPPLAPAWSDTTEILRRVLDGPDDPPTVPPQTVRDADATLVIAPVLPKRVPGSSLRAELGAGPQHPALPSPHAHQSWFAPARA